MPEILIQVYEKHNFAYCGQFSEPVELGRQTAEEEGPYCECQTDTGRKRLIVARSEEQTISRHHLLVEPLPGGRVRIENIRGKLPVNLRDNSKLLPNDSFETNLPYTLPLGKRSISLHAPDAESSSFHTFAHAAAPPGRVASAPPLLSKLEPGHDLESLFPWLHAAVEVLHSAAGASDFFQKASRAVVDLAGLDSCGVVLFKNGQWHAEPPETARTSRSRNWQPSRLVLNQVCRDKKTVWQVPDTPPGQSLVDVKAVVAAPILDGQGEVLGVLYGDRRITGRGSREISEVEALLVELLACSVAAGLARAEQEKAALTARVQFEQFFTPELSHQLASNPDLLRGQDAEVSILFCDIRGFSRISGRLRPAQTGEWINNVLEVLSDCALRHSGVLVDYLGDEIMTMWGAPEKQPDHARLACRAGLDMLAALPQLNERWQPILGEPLALTIGINTGTASVGNIGSRRKFKYGPLGNAVDLASRVRGATKYLGTNFLVTGTTEAQLDAKLERRRISRVRVVNIAQPVDLFEIAAPGQPDWPTFSASYAAALALLEQSSFREAAAALGKLLSDYPDDVPTQVLLSRALQAITSPTEEFDPIWQLPGK
jgi:adenylate cyclase